MVETIRLGHRAGDLVRKGAPFLDGKLLERGMRPLLPGTWVRLAGSKGSLPAWGLMDRIKTPVCRVMHVEEERTGPPDEAFFRERLVPARVLRQPLLEDPSLEVYRLINGEGDGIPGLVMDRYGDFGVAWVVTPGVRAISSMICRAAMEVFGLKGIYEKGPPGEGFHPGKGALDRPVLGESAPEALLLRERGMRLEARLIEGPRTGIYPDQRENRACLAPLVPGRRVLNAFSYTGAFSVALALAGAEGTVSVDLSARALEWSRRNFLHNGLDLHRHLHVKADFYDYLNLAAKKDRAFGMIILDPPTFSTSRKGRFQARKDWPGLLEGSLALLEKGGLLAVSCNTKSLSEKEMLSHLTRAAREGGCRMEVEAVWGLPLDFPAHPMLLRMQYLKFILARRL